MTDRPVNLDTRRSHDNQIAVEFRRNQSLSYGPDLLAMALVHDALLHSQMLAGPSDRWPDIATKAIFLIESYAKTSEAQEIRVQTLIRRVLHDIECMTRYEDHTP